MEKKIIILALSLGVISIILGAFAAHGLKNKLDASMLQSFETGVKYQLYQALFLLFIASTGLVSQHIKMQVFYFILAGVVFFSGSIYLLSTQSITNINFKKIGFITPIGGLLMIIGWALPIIHLLINKKG
jgi:uncharacterized membrane protein YgdD (TMEM256/DUF423 family)